MPSHFTLRMQFGLDQDAGGVADQLVQLVRDACVDEVMFFFFAEELCDGHQSPEHIRQWIEHSRPYRNALRDLGVLTSYNPYCSLYLDGDLGRKLKPGQHWQCMVDPFGLESRVVACPLDREWRKTYEQGLRLCAAEEFHAIWVDDDYRFHNHKPLAWGGCFCPLHVAEFNRRAGVISTREEIVANCTAPGRPHVWRDIWLSMWDETQTKLLGHFRKVVEEYGTRLGLMTSLPEAHAAEGRRWQHWFEALRHRVDNLSLVRPNFWWYGESLGEALPGFIARLDQNRSVQSSQVVSGPEIECYPYGAWNKSFRQTGAQIAMGQIFGASHLNISLYDTMGNRPDDEPQRAAFLRRWRPVCDWLADMFPPTLRSVGVVVPWSQDMGRALHTQESGDWSQFECPSRGWAHWLGGCGHAFSMREVNTDYSVPCLVEPNVFAIAGPVAWSFSDEQIGEWLSHGLLLDGTAAHILCQRGFGDRIGMENTRFVTQDEVMYSVEHCREETFSLRSGMECTVNRGPHTRRMLQGELADGVRVVSELRNPNGKSAGHGMVVFENDGDGIRRGRVAIVPWSATEDAWINMMRKTQLSAALEFLSRGSALGSAEGSVWLVPQFLADGAIWRGTVWNGGGDEVERISVQVPAGCPPPTRAVHVDACGRQHQAVVDKGGIDFEIPMHQWEFVVIC